MRAQNQSTAENLVEVIIVKPWKVIVKVWHSEWCKLSTRVLNTSSPKDCSITGSGCLTTERFAWLGLSSSPRRKERD